MNLCDPGLPWASGALAGLLLLGGCAGPHVQLEAPTAQSAPEERLAAYARLRPVNLNVIAVQPAIEAGRDAHPLKLADGTEVHHPLDLAAILPPDSEALRA